MSEVIRPPFYNDGGFYNTGAGGGEKYILKTNFSVYDVNEKKDIPEIGDQRVAFSSNYTIIQLSGHGIKVTAPNSDFLQGTAQFTAPSSGNFANYFSCLFSGVATSGNRSYLFIVLNYTVMGFYSYIGIVFESNRIILNIYKDLPNLNTNLVYLGMDGDYKQYSLPFVNINSLVYLELYRNDNGQSKLIINGVFCCVFDTNFLSNYIGCEISPRYSGSIELLEMDILA